MNATAQINDNFEGYSLGDMADQNPTVWGVWSGNLTNTSESIEVSNAFASSGTQSGRIGPGEGPQDVMLLLGNKTMGVHRLSFNMYIPAGKTAYFNIQGETSSTGGAGDGGQGVFNSSNLIFNNTSGTTGSAGTGGSYPNLTDNPEFSWEYPENTWFPVSILFEPEAGLWTMSVNNVALAPQELREDNIIGAIDFYALNTNNEFYLDDVLYEEEEVSNVDNPVLTNVLAYPNPVSDELTIETSEQVDEIILYDILGNLLLKNIPNDAFPVMDFSKFNPGLYFVRVKIGNQTTTFQVTK